MGGVRIPGGNLPSVNSKAFLTQDVGAVGTHTASAFDSGSDMAMTPKNATGKINANPAVLFKNEIQPIPEENK